MIVNTTSMLIAAVAAALPGSSIEVAPGIYSPGWADTKRMFLQVNVRGLTLRAVVSYTATLDGLNSCHSLIDLQGNSAGFTLEGFNATRGAHGGVWSNSMGGLGAVVRNTSFTNIGNPVDTSTDGNAPIYFDAGGSLLVENCIFSDNGRANVSSMPNSFDHSLYLHCRSVIRRNVFANSPAGWHIQTATGFSGEIEDNEFFGPNMYDSKPGQVMLWGTCGPIAFRRNKHYGTRLTALTDYAFTSPLVTVEDAVIFGAGTLGAPAGAIETGTRNILI
jgi:hypothetical protein